MIIKCKQCAVELTENLHSLQDKYLINEDCEKDFIPRGYYLIEDGNYFTQEQGNIIVCTSSIKNIVDHFDSNRLSGCCGLGSVRLNQTCINKHEIGTMFSDCWTPLAMVFDSQLTMCETDR